MEGLVPHFCDRVGPPPVLPQAIEQVVPQICQLVCREECHMLPGDLEQICSGKAIIPHLQNTSSRPD